ncbi:conjugal transfer protein [Mycobacterium attenuatum]|uniref:conjugal transfer protein n=1 Tax=Mycobacterium attenuatum TaxID=2341086 RepID=UPI000F03CC16|nr:conjugal transfer protein [Mycobacterium attenuatum]VBA62387.1 hypothetical protein LAUMK41_05778 [Mycobacterium attenuatum]
MKITNTWKRRLHTAGTAGRHIGFAALVATSSISGVSQAWRFFFPPPPPPIAAISRAEINETDRVKSFAAQCVEALLTSNTSADITRCYPDGHKYTLPTTAAMTVSNAKPQATKFGPATATVRIYAVKVDVDEQPYPGAAKTPAKYQLPVAVYQNSGMQALDKIARLQPDPPGAYLPLGYSVAIDKSPPNSTELTPLFALLTGFANAYLTSAGGLNRFTTTDAGISAVGDYAAATVTAAQAAETPPENPADNTQLAVHIDVAARRPDYSQVLLAYPLTLRALGGSWFVARIDALPVVADTTPTPAPPPVANTR